MPALHPARWLAEPWFQLFVTLLGLGASLAATLHVLSHKRDTRSAIGWIALIWLSPFVGGAVYVLLGVNRIRRKAQRLREEAARRGRTLPIVGHRRLAQISDDATRHLLPLARLVERLTRRPLWSGNVVEPLDSGDAAYPAMFRAIESATRSIGLSTYIFYPDRAGRPIIDALARAAARGVVVRVLIDSVGSRYGFTSAVRPLRRAGVRVATFNPTLSPGWFRFLNLRNHRKLMVVDGRDGFTGGMNILADYQQSLRPRRPKRDLHFAVRGPAVEDLQRAFVADWAFSTGELLEGDAWFPEIDPIDEARTLARGIADGPDDDADHLTLTLMGALASARSNVSILTPYFVPETPLIGALGVAALRGVQVDILVPRVNNHRLVQWAMTPLLEPLLEMGCRVWLTEPPFDHSKLMLVDGIWTLLGSANWDARSLVLNFEYNLECYDEALAARLAELVETRRAGAHRLTLANLRERPRPVKLRDSLARLLTPYL